MALVSAIALTSAICLASFVLSFAALWDLATQAGQPRGLAWLFPVVIDGTILQATISVVSTAQRTDRTSVHGRRFFWLVLLSAAATSIACNALHAGMSHTSTIAPAIAAAIATAAPIGLLASTHGIAILVRTPKTEPADTSQSALTVARSIHHGPPAPDDLPAPVWLAAVEPDTEDSPGAVATDDEVLDAFAPAEEVRDRGLRLLEVGRTAPEVAALVGKHVSTVYRWNNDYRAGLARAAASSSFSPVSQAEQPVFAGSGSRS